ncbi:PREDICTED: putative F-box/LRR-repeat/kelch-repeat protein At1g11620 [Camelina sativa]|uniref:F-box/LRR-repeat/kelch-repeat protein At1g11620 n=1 Tax=Camelina sativa TaxID=90675 RepID=A0ABM0SKZ1_CAMSA|nr:PREDICTED: putative F-box/LRR-repeat/kelch-repeat protein At1g11620 [Camelina sativa]
MTMPIDLPSDLQEEVLSRVPMKSLARFRAVCKQWNTLFVEDRFLAKHYGEHHFLIGTCFGEITSLNIKDNTLILLQNLSVGNIRPKKLQQYIKVYKIGHCDGVLYYVLSNQILVWNPLLKLSRWIECDCSEFFELDEAYGLGYIRRSSSIYDYKLVRFRCPRNSKGRRATVEVYEFTSNMWKTIDISFDWFLRVPLASVSLRGTPYWIGLREDNTAFIQSFDFIKERFEPLDHLPFKYVEDNFIALDIFKGDRLSLLHQCSTTRKINIWVKDCIMSWTRLMTVDIPELPVLYERHIVLPAVYFVVKDNELVISAINSERGFLDIYIVRKKDFQKIETYLGFCVSIACKYRPSLVRLPGFSKQNTSPIGQWKENDLSSFVIIITFGYSAYLLFHFPYVMLVAIFTHQHLKISSFSLFKINTCPGMF